MLGSLSGKMEPMSDTSAPAQGLSDYGRVDADGTVYVRTNDGERSVGQVPDATADEAMAFFVRRFTALDTEVSLVEARINSGALAGEDARRSINHLKSSIAEANAVGDLASLTARLDALAPQLAAHNEARKAEKAAASAQTKQAKEQMVTEAEKLAVGNDWRGGVNRFRALLEEWKKLPRLDRATDDELWHRFSTARTTYTRRRKAQFAEQSEKRSGAQTLKEQIIDEARSLAESTEWGPTSGAFRELMNRWKAAGPAPRAVDDKLWKQFRGLQDQFFDARTAAQSAQDAEFGDNLKAKESLLAKAEAEVVPVKDLAASKAAFRSFLEQYNELGKVPRDAIRRLNDRVNALEKAVLDAEEREWRRTDPEARQRASDTVDMFTAQINKLVRQAAHEQSAGRPKKAEEIRASIATYQTWLEQARTTLAEFS